jgi:hypothetical protein
VFAGATFAVADEGSGEVLVGDGAGSTGAGAGAITAGGVCGSIFACSGVCLREVS